MRDLLILNHCVFFTNQRQICKINADLCHCYGESKQSYDGKDYINNAAGASLWLFGLVDFFQPFIKRFFKALLRGIDKLQRL